MPKLVRLRAVSVGKNALNLIADSGLLHFAAPCGMDPFPGVATLSHPGRGCAGGAPEDEPGLEGPGSQGLGQT